MPVASDDYGRSSRRIQYEPLLMQLLCASDQLLVQAENLHRTMATERANYNTVRRIATFQSSIGITLFLIAVLAMPTSDWTALVVGMFGVFNLAFGGLLRTGTEFLEAFRANKHEGPMKSLRKRHTLISRTTEGLFKQMNIIVLRLASWGNSPENSATHVLKSISEGRLRVRTPEREGWAKYIEVIKNSLIAMPTTDPAFNKALNLSNAYRGIEFCVQASTGLIFFEPDFTNIFSEDSGIRGIYALTIGTILAVTFVDLVNLFRNWTNIRESEAELGGMIEILRVDLVRCSWVLKSLP